MTRTWIALCSALFLAHALAAAAAAEPRIRQGDRELSLHISPDFEGAIGDMIFVQAGYGVFVRDRLALRGTFSYTLLEDVSGLENDYKMQELAAVAEYHVPLGERFVPYAGLSVGYAKSLFANTEESALVYGPRVGLKTFLADNAALDFEVSWRAAAADVFVNDFVREDSDLSLLFGVRILF